ncbi:hypothetical protein ACFQ48_20685 [Hymenobacter caeli]|uniref:Glycosyltransferase RgtA/B/C/D-like domain-containing protein n=1 Tax=Hymenobacter caeli TaxID=2735894 RepID=A0ABX2FY95_9BACT|nr:hypothetical protein [Hymenobacter caeli]NRT21384.1 hypothetical protein [Hymenobacter caeli]
MNNPPLVPGFAASAGRPARSFGERAGRAAGAALLVLGALALLAYLLTPYAALRDWYLGRTPDLYRAATWPVAFFTPAVKARGNGLAGLALVGLAGRWWRHRNRPLPAAGPAPAAPLLSRADAPWLAGLLVLAAGLWAWGATRVPPAYDEVFSAVFCAGSGSVFVAWSYYMLPNNHVLFNVLNGTLFGGLHNASLLVFTGRALSGLAYAGTLAVVYRLGTALSGRRWAGAGLAVLAAVQFSLWGFGFQARGYALYALLHWVALATLLGHWQQPRRRGWLVANAWAVAAGYATVPTFLFYHAAQLLAAAAEQLRQRRFDGRFWACQAGALALAGAFYLPVLGFSGLAALAANPYVLPAKGPLGAFVAAAWPDVKGYAAYCFGGVWPAYALALLPLALLACRPWRRLGLLYLAWLLVLAGGTLALRHVVFHRNLLGLFSVALVLGPLAVGALLGRWRRWAGALGAVALGVWLAVGFVRHSPMRDATNLYYYNIADTYALAQQRLWGLPAGASVAFAEESFYPYWLYQRGGGQAAHPAHRPAYPAAYYITAPNDGLPPALAPRYQPVDTVGGYRLWRLRAGGVW